MISREKKAEAMSKLARSKEDVGSPEVQVAVLTERMKEVTEHVKEIPRTHELRALQEDDCRTWAS